MKYFLNITMGCNRTRVHKKIGFKLANVVNSAFRAPIDMALIGMTMSQGR